MNLLVLGVNEYEDPGPNYGDCILIVDGGTAVVYDCGSEEHAKRIVSELDRRGIEKATVFLSHNDNDHFKGIPYLINHGRVDKLFSILLLKYTDRLLSRIDDNRRKREPLKEAILELYDNIASLSQTVPLRDVYEDEEEFPSFICRVGPDIEYMLDAAAKGLDTREGDSIDSETITNAASVQIKVKFGYKKLLLTGDCAVAAIPTEERLDTYDYIQLPHHGKLDSAEKIFDRVGSHYELAYLVSDNTGNSSGGSDALRQAHPKGLIIKNTRTDGDISISSVSSVSSYTGTLGL